jgi:hypothetical protein
MPGSSDIIAKTESKKNLLRPITFHPYLTVGLAFQAWGFRSPNRTINALSGAWHAHFEGFLHDKNKG